MNYKYTFAFGQGLAYDENGNASVVKLTFLTEAAEFDSAGDIIL